MGVERRDLERRRAASRARRSNHKVSVLSTPKPPAGWRFYWANRFRSNGKDDIENFSLKQREGFVFVTLEEIDKLDKSYIFAKDESASNRVIVGDLVLMKIKLEDAEDLEFAEDDQARAMDEAYKRDLLSATTSLMPVIDQSTTRRSSSTEFA